MTPHHDYWSAARAPFCCLVFLTPLLLFYEFGVLWLGGANPETLRNGADYWMRLWLESQGGQSAWLLPVLVVAILLGWQIIGKFPWKCRAETLVGMTAESMLFACVLLMLAHVQDWLFQNYFDPTRLALSTRPASNPVLARLVTFLGAGIYEEVLFRLLAIPTAQVAFRFLQVPATYARSCAIVSSSLVFSAAHYIGPAADTFTAFSFIFRILAGLFFGLLFVLRGFGITVGAHAGYDVLVGILLKAA